VGSHQVSVFLIDSDGNQVTLTHALEVLASDLPAPRLRGAVPEAELIVALYPDDLGQYTPETIPQAEGETPDTGNDFPTGLIWGGAGVLVLLGAALAWSRSRDRSI
jgi:LPXTG-motif cell wall-anchored protein